MAQRLGVAVENLRTLSVDVEETQLEFRRSHATFFANCQLSFCVAVMVTFVGLPSYCYSVKEYLFGEPVCTEADLYRKVSVNGTLVAYDSPQANGAAESVWCGLLPNNYLGNWPNFVQMIVFTVYQNTGTTIMQAWQGMIGTFVAVLNIYLMDLLYPHETDSASSTVAWVDTYLFIFLVLVSGSQENTMKFAMSWHVFFMMTFLDPHHENQRGVFSTGLPRLEWDQYTVVVFMTAVAGVTVAVVSTVLPPPGLLNYKRVVSDSDVAMKAVSKIWTESINYFCGSGRSAKRFVLAEAITSLNTTVGQVKGNLSNSWWETFDLLGFGKKRALFNAFDTTLQKMGSVMVAVQDSVLTEDFGGTHQSFCKDLFNNMSAVKAEAVELLERCQAACKDGDIDEAEAEEIKEAIVAVKDSQLNLLLKYQELSRDEKAMGATCISKDLSNENEFAFALSVWARKIVDFADNIVKMDLDLDEQNNSCVVTLLQTLKNGCINTWRPPTMEKLIWAVRNFIPISFAFWLGYRLPCPFSDAIDGPKMGVKTCSKNRVLASVFTPFDANMANTLGLLINHYPGSALINNIMRLLGVTLGKVMPIVILGFLNVLRRESAEKTVMTGVAIFIFTWLTNYMYYSSQRWSTVGCLMAGFGCAMLITPTSAKAMTDFSPHYKDIAQVVMAIVLQIMIDAVFDYIQDDFPRDMAVKKMGGLKDAFHKAFEAFFDGETAEFEDAINVVQGLLEGAKALQHEADPEMQLVPCYRTDFKIQLFRASLKYYDLLFSDLTMLLLAVRSWKSDPPPRDGNDMSAWEVASDDDDEEAKEWLEFDPLEYMQGLDAVHGKNGIKNELLQSLDMVLSSLEKILGHGAEDNNFQEAERTMELVNMRVEGFARGEELYSEINRKPFDSNTYAARSQVCEDPRVKVTVAVRSLERAKAHIGEIEKLMMPYIVL